MKNFRKIILIFLIGIAATISGCKEKLELAPYNQLSDATAFATPERCLLALNGVYDAAQSGDYDPLNGTAHSVRGYPFGAASIAQGEMRGEDMVNIATFYQITYLATYSTVSPNNVNMWINLYLLINKANLSIDGFKAALAQGTISATTEAQYEAECRFLRAMAHHDLLIHFARPYLDGNGSALGVPYHDYAISSSSSLDKLKAQKRDLVSVCYAKMMTDLDFAIANLGATVPATVPGAAVPAGANTFRATKAAAYALRMRLKLHMGDWQGVITEGNNIIPTAAIPATNNTNYWTTVVSPIGGWKLELLPNGPFTNNQSTESIFSIRNDALDNTGVNASLAQMMGPNGSGRGLVAISPTIYNLPAWRCDDTRRSLLTLQGLSNTGTTSYFTKKYTDYVNQADYAPYIRYAEVLLMQAEAEARNAAAISQRAIDLLNLVRNRAIPTPVTNQYTAASFADKNALIKAILDERRIEFLAEGKRWGDIHRLAKDPVFSTGGIPAKAANGYSTLAAYGCSLATPALTVTAIPYSDYRFLWPIPQDERTQNPIIDQNPGY